MIQASLRKFGNTWRNFAVAVAVVGALSFTLVPSNTTYAASATYSCGTYSAGSYSTGGGCATSSPGNTGGGSGVGAPNTGFAKLMEPTNLMAILGSLALLAAGVIIMLKSKGRKKQDVSFHSRD